jgi:hypothetical protein
LAVVSFGPIYFFGSQPQRSTRKISRKKAHKAQNEFSSFAKDCLILLFCGFLLLCFFVA